MAEEKSLSPRIVAESKELSSEDNSLDATDSFLKSEQDYVEKGLRRGFDIFVDRLEIHIQQNEPILKTEEINDIFGTFKVIYNANSDLLEQLLNVRMNRKLELRDNLGEIMAKFTPYLKLYIDYIVKKQAIINKINKLKKSNKKFSKFLLINEACARRKIKSFLDEPVARLPQYLQQMAQIYIAWEREDLGSLELAESKKHLFNAISNVRKVTEEISEKVKNKKARRLLGLLQTKLFNNKIALIASHRLVVHHGEAYLLNKNTLELCHFVLCNDILVIAKSKSKSNANAMLHVLPLIGLKIERDPVVADKVKNKDNLPAFAIKGILAGAVKLLTIFSESDQDRIDWINIIEDAVDEEEHSRFPCNPVDLEKRLRKEKCSPEGTADTLTVTDPAVLQKIQEWKKLKTSGKSPTPSSKHRTMTNLSPKPRKAPPKGHTGRAAPPRAPLVPTNSAGSNNSGKAAPPSAPNSGAPAPPRKPHGAKPPPKRPGAPPKSPNSGNAGNHLPPKGPAAPPPVNAPSVPSGGPTRPARPGRGPPGGGRAGFLSGIANFDKKGGLKKIDTVSPRASTVSTASTEPAAMGDLLVSTLANYRQYVMDEDSEDEGSDAEWDD